MNENLTAETAETAEKLYSLDEPQTVFYEKKQRGRKFKLGQTIGAISDAVIIKCVNEIEQLERQDSNSDYEISTSDEAALENFWRSVCTATVGYKMSDGRELSEMEDYAESEKKKTRRWQDYFLEKYYADAIQVANHVLAFIFEKDASEIAETVINETDSFIVEETDGTTYRAEAPIGNDWKKLSITLAAPNAAQNRKFKEISKAKRYRKVEKGLALIVETQTEGLLKLYDGIKVSTINYAGEPPAHHKIAVTRRHLNKSVRILEKN